MRLKTTSYWDNLGALAEKYSTTADRLVKVAKISPSTVSGLRKGAEPHAKTQRRIHSALELYGWDGIWMSAS